MTHSILYVLNIIRCTILLLHRNSISLTLYRWHTGIDGHPAHLGVFTPEVQDTPILWQYNFFLHEDKLCGLQQGTAVVPVYSFYFYRDMTSLVWLTVPPSSGKSIHTFNGGCGERKRDRRKEGGLLKRRHFATPLISSVMVTTKTPIARTSYIQEQYSTLQNRVTDSRLLCRIYFYDSYLPNTVQTHLHTYFLLYDILLQTNIIYLCSFWY